MVVHTKDEKKYGDAETLVSESRARQDDVEELAGRLRASMTELHALQDEFERTVKSQEKALNNLAKTLKSDAKRKKKRTPATETASPGLTGSSSSAPLPTLGTADSAPAEENESSTSSSHEATNSASSRVDTEVSASISVSENGNGSRVAASPASPSSSGARDGQGAAGDSRADALREIRTRLAQKELQHLMPSSGGFYVELFLGALNVRFIRKKDRLAFKTEYEKLKLKLAPGLVVLAVVCLVYEENRWVHMLLQLCLSWYYATLAVRENILRVNGSNIKPWWIIHHYFTMAQCVLLLTWPNNASYALFRRSLHLFGLYNAVLQIFQTRYQMARLYALRSLGMASEMDVASSDSTQIRWSEGMIVLLPLILLGQAMQAGQAWNLMRIYQSSPTELQILMLSLLFSANFVGNLYTTLLVLYEKRIRSRKAARDARVVGTQEDKKRA